MPDELAGIAKIAEGKTAPDSMTSTYYFKGGRMRSEQTTKGYNFIGVPTKNSDVEIRQCDKKETLFFNNKEKEFWSVPFTAESGSNPKDRKKQGVVTITETVTDTGERKELFGFKVRRVKTMMIIKPGDGSCMEESNGSMVIEKDGWYADIAGFDCPEAGSLMPNLELECEDRIEHRINGKPENGFAFFETTTVRMGSMPAMKVIEEVVSVDRSSLPDKLFEAPEGYRRINQVIGK